MVQLNLLRHFNVSVTIKNVSIRGFMIWKKKHTKGLGGKGKLANIKIGTVQNYFGMVLRSNAGNLAAMKSACMALMYHICGYHYNCPKHVDTWYQYQKDKQDNTSYCTSKCDLSIDVRKTILPINQSLCKTEMLEKRYRLV